VRGWRRRVPSSLPGKYSRITHFPRPIYPGLALQFAGD
jgi:hypothetical protein